jgi:hypothetical protein
VVILQCSICRTDSLGKTGADLLIFEYLFKNYEAYLTLQKTTHFV